MTPLSATASLRTASAFRLSCASCGREACSQDGFTLCPACGASLGFGFDYARLAEGLNVHVLKSAPMRATKYLDFFPLSNRSRVVSLNEGGTPLYRGRNLEKHLGLRRLWLKFEGSNPTGGFKDRGSMVEVSKALETGAKTLVCASTGNMAASVAAYAVVAGLPCYILVPEGTPAGKMAQTLAFGARVVQVRGSYDDAARLAGQLSGLDGFFLCGDYALRLEGQKSQAYEVAEQLGWRSPDRVVVPVGNGTNAAAVAKGFAEFSQLGLVDGVPRLTGVQPESCRPVVDAFRSGGPVVPLLRPQTVASAVCVGKPSDAGILLDAVRQSGGCFGSASDAQVLEAQKKLARLEALFVEPAAALGLAALENMLADDSVGSDEEVVLVLTGSGLKDPTAALRVLPSPPTVEPRLEEVQKLLDYDYYRICAEPPAHSGPVLVDGLPSSEALAELLHGAFDVRLQDADLAACRALVSEFLERHKALRRNDLKLVVEQALQRPRLAAPVLSVVDFSVTTGRHSRPCATATVSAFGRTLTCTAQGVGPVDAVINAVRKAVQGRMDFSLADYRVGINTRNTDASVDVRITLEDAAGNKVTTMGASPDIIAASVQAFVEGCNLLAARQGGGAP